MNNAVAEHCWELEGHGFGVVYSAGMGVDLELNSEV